MAVNGKNLKDNVPWAIGFHVTKDGRVFSRIRPRSITNVWREKKQYKHKNGYLRVTILGEKFSVHRLVAMIYKKREIGKNIVMHLDNDKCNNNVNNLKWGTAKENNEQTHREGRTNYSNVSRNKGETNGNSKMSNETRDNILRLHLAGFNRKYIMQSLNVTKGQHRRITKQLKKTWE